jgi:hypothetical protein
VSAAGRGYRERSAQQHRHLCLHRLCGEHCALGAGRQLKAARAERRSALRDATVRINLGTHVTPGRSCQLWRPDLLESFPPRTSLACR